MTLGPAVPALPVADMTAAVACYRERLRFAVIHQEDAFAVVQRDDCLLHLWLADDDSWRARPDLAKRPVRGGAETFLAGTASCRIRVGDAAALHALFDELAATGVLHPVSRTGVAPTDYGDLELHALDADGNLLSFFFRG